MVLVKCWQFFFFFFFEGLYFQENFIWKTSILIIGLMLPFHWSLLLQVLQLMWGDSPGIQSQGLATPSPRKFDQCRKEGYVSALKSIKEEGCQVYGYLQVNRVISCSIYL